MVNQNNNQVFILKREIKNNVNNKIIELDFTSLLVNNKTLY